MEKELELETAMIDALRELQERDGIARGAAAFIRLVEELREGALDMALS